MKIAKLHPDAVVPKYATPGSAGFDLHVLTPDGAPVYLNPGQQFKFRTGLAFEIPEGFDMSVHPRSGLGSNNGIVLGNLTGIIDSDYRNEVFVTLWNRNHDGEAFKISHLDRAVQAIIRPYIQVVFDVVPHEELSVTERGMGGYGSTGIK